MIQIFVINLDRSADRWASINGQLDDLGLTDLVVRLPAIDGVTNDVKPFWSYVNQKRAKRLKGRELSHGQVGCFASHYSVWQQIAAGSRGAIVLEDDVGLTAGFRDFIGWISINPIELGCVRLFINTTKKAKAIRIANQGSFSVFKYTKGHMGAQGYYLTPKVASQLLSHATSWFQPVDLYMDAFWHHGVECLGIEPPVVRRNDGATTRGDSTRRALSPWEKLKKEFFAIVPGVKRRLHNMVFRIRA